jgi:hypothetical protein
MDVHHYRKPGRARLRNGVTYLLGALALGCLLAAGQVLPPAPSGARQMPAVTAGAPAISAIDVAARMDVHVDH